jgi:hypothetical protein
MKQWYEELFEDYGMKYDKEEFAQGTIGECDFIEKEIEYFIPSRNSSRRRQKKEMQPPAIIHSI